MGTDISLYVETYELDDAGHGCWRYLPHPTRYPGNLDWSGAHDRSAAGKREGWYEARNYVEFAVLAGLRNHRMDPPIVPIAPPRGLPIDRDTDSDPAREIMDGTDHSHGWVLLSELLAYDWDQRGELTGVIPLRDPTYRKPGPRQLGDYEGYLEWQARGGPACGPPDGYCGGVGGDRNAVTVDMARADALLRGEAVTFVDCGAIGRRDGFFHDPFLTAQVKTRAYPVPDMHHTIAHNAGVQRVYVQAAWTETVRAHSGGLLALVDELAAATPGKNPSDIRLVFGFDS